MQGCSASGVTRSGTPHRQLNADFGFEIKIRAVNRVEYQQFSQKLCRVIVFASTRKSFFFLLSTSIPGTWYVRMIRNFQPSKTIGLSMLHVLVPGKAPPPPPERNLYSLSTFALPFPTCRVSPLDFFRWKKTNRIFCGRRISSARSWSDWRVWIRSCPPSPSASFSFLIPLSQTNHHHQRS